MCGVVVKRHFNRLFFKEKQCNVSAQTGRNRRGLVSSIYSFPTTCRVWSLTQLPLQQGWTRTLWQFCLSHSQHRQTNTDFHSQFRDSHMWLDCGWDLRTGDNAHRKASGLNLGPSCCEAMVLTMTPPPPVKEVP